MSAPQHPDIKVMEAPSHVSLNVGTGPQRRRYSNHEQHQPSGNSSEGSGNSSEDNTGNAG